MTRLRSWLTRFRAWLFYWEITQTDARASLKSVAAGLAPPKAIAGCERPDGREVLRGKATRWQLAANRIVAKYRRSA